MKYLITGGTGSLGHQLSKHLEGEKVIFSRDEFKQSQMKRKFPDNTYIVGDIRDKERLREAVRDTSPDFIIHAAAMKRIETCEEHPWECILTEVYGAKNVVDVCKEFNIPSIAISTDKAVEPINTYGMSKALQEQIFLNAGFNVVRYGNVFNSRGSVIPIWLEMKKNGKPLEVRDPEATRFIMTLEEAQSLIEDAMEAEPSGKIFIPEKLKSIEIQTLAECISDNIIHTKLGKFEKKHESLTKDNSSHKAERISKEEMRKMIDNIDEKYWESIY